MKRFIAVCLVAMSFGFALPAQAGVPVQNPIPSQCQAAVNSGQYRVIFAQPGVVTNAGSGSQVIIGTPGEDIIYAGSGNDIVCGGDDYDQIYGGSGDDILYGNRGYDDIFGESGNDQLYGNRNNLDGGGVGDIIEGGSGGDFLDGGRGNADRCIGDSGSDTYTARCEEVID